METITLQERIFTQPASFLAGCLVWLPVTVWFVSFVHWMVMGELDIVTGILGLFTSVALGYITMNPPRQELGPIFFVCVVLMVVVYPFIRSGLTQRELNSIDCDAMDKAYDALAFRPGNPAATFRLAKLAIGRGLIGPGLALAERVLPQMPFNHFRDEHRQIHQWRTMVRPDQVRPLPCIECHAQVPLGEAFCPACGSRYLVDHARGKFVSGAMGRKLLAAWITLLLALVGIPLATTLPPALTIITVVMILVSVGLVLWRAFSPETRGATA